MASKKPLTIFLINRLLLITASSLPLLLRLLTLLLLLLLLLLVLFEQHLELLLLLLLLFLQEVELWLGTAAGKAGQLGVGEVARVVGSGQARAHGVRLVGSQLDVELSVTAHAVGVPVARVPLHVDPAVLKTRRHRALTVLVLTAPLPIRPAHHSSTLYHCLEEEDRREMLEAQHKLYRFESGKGY